MFFFLNAFEACDDFERNHEIAEIIRFLSSNDLLNFDTASASAGKRADYVKYFSLEEYK